MISSLCSPEAQSRERKSLRTSSIPLAGDIAVRAVMSPGSIPAGVSPPEFSNKALNISVKADPGFNGISSIKCQYRNGAYVYHHITPGRSNKFSIPGKGRKRKTERKLLHFFLFPPILYIRRHIS